jgi:hypothetical protein
VRIDVEKYTRRQPVEEDITSRPAFSMASTRAMTALQNGYSKLLSLYCQAAG